MLPDPLLCARTHLSHFLVPGPAECGQTAALCLGQTLSACQLQPAIPNTEAFVWAWTWVQEGHGLCGWLSGRPSHPLPTAPPILWSLSEPPYWPLISFWPGLERGSEEMTQRCDVASL
jgi:hypothetical protein